MDGAQEMGLFTAVDSCLVGLPDEHLQEDAHVQTSRVWAHLREEQQQEAKWYQHFTEAHMQLAHTPDNNAKMIYDTSTFSKWHRVQNRNF